MPKSTTKPRRALATALESSTTAPSELRPSQTIARVSKAEGNHLYSVYLPWAFQIAHVSNEDAHSGNVSKAEMPETLAISETAETAETLEAHLVELMPALRSTVFLRRNGYVLVDTDRELLGGRENKIVGTIVGVVLGGKLEREWRAMPYWPGEFGKTAAWDYGDDDDGPRMPSDDGDDED